MWNSQLAALPESFGGLASLVELDLSSNELAALPDKDPDGPLRQVLGRETVEHVAAGAASACQVLEQEVIAMVADGRAAGDMGAKDAETSSSRRPTQYHGTVQY